jgi:hypothetical protein
MAYKGSQRDRTCRARSADPVLGAEDRSTRGSRDRMGPKLDVLLIEASRASIEGTCCSEPSFMLTS